MNKIYLDKFFDRPIIFEGEKCWIYHDKYGWGVRNMKSSQLDDLIETLGCCSNFEFLGEF